MNDNDKYTALAKKILIDVGGTKNIISVTHCITRLRFNLKDASIPDDDKIRKIDGVIQVIRAGGQYQVVIGQTVSDVYNALIKLGDGNLVEEIPLNENLDKNIKKEKITFKTILNKIIDVLVGSIVPVIPILIGSGIIQAFLMIFQSLKWISPKSPTYITLSFVASAAFYFLPVYVGAFAAKKFNTSIPIGMLLGGMLISPTFIEMVTKHVPMSVFGLPIYPAQYGSTIVPALLAVWIMSYVQKIIAKYSPKSIRIILEPTLTILIMVPITLCALAPVGQMLSSGFVNTMIILHNVLGPFEIAIFAALVPFIVMFGLHVGTVPFSIGLIKSTGMDNIIAPPFFISNFAQGAALLGVGFKTKSSNLKQLSFSSAFSAIIPGVTEPGMYGVTLKYKTPMIAAMIGAACGGLYMGFTNVGVKQFLPPNMFQIVAYMKTPMDLVNVIIAIVITMIITFIATLILFKEKKEVN